MPHLVPRQDPARHQVACVKPAPLPLRGADKVKASNGWCAFTGWRRLPAKPPTAEGLRPVLLEAARQNHEEWGESPGP